MEDEPDGEVGDGPSTKDDAGAASDAHVAPQEQDASRGDAGSSTTTDAGSRDAGTNTRDAGTRDAGTRDAGSGTTRDASMPMGPSSGCGKTTSDKPGEFNAHTLKVGTSDRTYQLFLPEGYQAMKRYPVVFRFHGSGGDGLSGGLDIQDIAPKDMIVVAPDGLNKTWSMGNTDVALFDALVSAVGEQYCVDLGRMFSYGFSAGAAFTDMLSCIRGNTLRGVAAVEGYDWGKGKTCEGMVAAWMLHDNSDTTAPIAGGRAARDRVLQLDGCAMETDPAGEGCVRYRGCAEGHPVVWCETDGHGHDIRGDYAPEQAWKFFSALPM